jgi:hypothetical protein
MSIREIGDRYNSYASSTQALPTERSLRFLPSSPKSSKPVSQYRFHTIPPKTQISKSQPESQKSLILRLKALLLSKREVPIEEYFAVFKKLNPQTKNQCYELLIKDQVKQIGIDLFLANPKCLLPILDQIDAEITNLKTVLERDEVTIEDAFEAFKQLKPADRNLCYQLLCKPLVRERGIDEFLANPKALLKIVNIKGQSLPIIDHLVNAEKISREEHLAIAMNFPFMPGRHTLKSQVVGTRKQELQAIKARMWEEPILRDLQAAIYKSKYIYLIPTDKKDEADEISRELFLQYIEKYAPYGCTEQNIVGWFETGAPGGASNKTYIYDIENEWNTWCVHIIVESRNGEANEKDGCYLPPHIVAYHELMHLEETPPGAKASIQNENGCEILTALKTIILIDFVYKRIHNLKIDSMVDYQKTIKLQGRTFQLGAFANFYRKLESKYGNLSRAVLSQESLRYLRTGK